MKKVQILVLDDLNEEVPAQETVHFSLDAVDYEIDLSQQNADALRTALVPYTKHGRKDLTRNKAHRAPNKTKGGKTAEVREWAKNHGYHVNDRGRIPVAVMNEYLYPGLSVPPTASVDSLPSLAVGAV
jgi:hypothetical protein